MRKLFAALLCMTSVLTLATGCGGSTGGEEGAAVAKVYAVKAPEDTETLTLIVKAQTSQAFSAAAAMDVSELTTTELPDLSFKSAKSLFIDEENKIITAAQAIGESSREHFLISISTANGKAAIFNSAGEYNILGFFRGGNALYAFIKDLSGNVALRKLDMASGDTLAETALDFSGALGGLAGNVEITGDLIEYDPAADKVYILVNDTESSKLLAMNLTTKAITRVDVNLGDAYAFAALSIINGKPHLLRDSINGSTEKHELKFLKINGDGSDPETVFQADYSGIINPATETASLVGYSSLTDHAAGTIYTIMTVTDGETYTDHLITINMATGNVTSLDTVIGCYYAIVLDLP